MLSGLYSERRRMSTNETRGFFAVDGDRSPGVRWRCLDFTCERRRPGESPPGVRPSGSAAVVSAVTSRAMAGNRTTVWVAEFVVSDRTSQKLAHKHHITVDEVEQAVKCVAGLRGSWDHDPIRGNRFCCLRRYGVAEPWWCCTPRRTQECGTWAVRTFGPSADLGRLGG